MRRLGRFILVLDVCVFGVRGLRVSEHKRVWQWPESSSRTLLCSTSGTCNCSYSLSLCASLPPADRTHDTTCGSFSFPTEWDFPHVARTPDPLCQEARGSGSWHNNPATPPDIWAQTGRWSRTRLQWPPGCLRCCPRAFVSCPFRVSGPGRALL